MTAENPRARHGQSAAGMPGAAGGPGAAAVARARGLRVTFPNLAHPAVDGVDLQVRSGECLALVGESGSGKTVSARALLGLSGGEVSASELDVLGIDCAPGGKVFTRERQWLDVRRAGAAMITQDALAGLDPLRPIGRELADAKRAGRGRPGQPTLDEALAAVGFAEASERTSQRSGQLSGGMRQRILIAQALLAAPRLLIADEATTALDPRLTSLILGRLEALKEAGCALIVISHDLAQVERVADRIAVMRAGEVVEEGPARQVLTAPNHPYTKMLLAAIPDGVPRGQRLLATDRTAPTGEAGREPGELENAGAPLPAPTPASRRVAVTERASAATDAAPAPAQPAAPPALRIDGVTKRFGGQIAVDDLSLTIAPGRTLGLVGQSGCGKTTTARLALGLLTPDRGRVFLGGELFSPLPERQRRAQRDRLAAIYQDPLSSFDPRYKCGAILASAMTAGRTRSWRAHREDVTGLLAGVGLAEDVLARYPWELSGGQRQRLAIARALSRHPQVLIFDEPVSALDASIQARVLDLLDEVQERSGAAYLFISHDPAVIEHMSDEVAVMENGRIVDYWNGL